MRRNKMLFGILFIVGALIFLFIASFVGCTNPATPAGHEGYVAENPRIWGNGGFRGVLKGPANYGVSLWRNEVINATLTSNYLQHEAINAQLKMASSPNHTTVYIPSGPNGIPLVGTVNGKSR